MLYALRESFASDDQGWGISREDKAAGIRQLTHKLNKILILLGREDEQIDEFNG